MWNFWCFRTNVEKINEKTNEQTTIAFFIDFDLILYIAIEKFEHFDDKNCETIFVENIWLRDVAKKINETNETKKHSIVDFFLILYVDFDVKTRKSKLLIDFRTWCWRICSWNLLLKLKFCLQRLQIRTQTICLIENFFIDFDANSNVDNWKIARSVSNLMRKRTIWIRIFAIDFAKIFATFAIFAIESDVLFAYSNVISNIIIKRFERFDESICEIVFIFDIRFLDVAKKIDDFCENDVHVTIDFSTNSLVKSEQNFENFWIKISWYSDSNVWNDDFDEIKKHWIDSFFFDSDTVFDVWIEKWKLSCEMTISKINVDLNICFDVAIEIDDFSDEIEQTIVDFFFVSHVNLIVSIEKNELTIERFWTSIFWNFWTEICNFCETNRIVTFLIVDFFFVLHIDLNARNRKNELMTNFFACCSRLCSRNDFLKLKISSQCRHVDNFFIDFDAISNVKNWKIERFNKMIVSIVIANSNIDFWNFVNDSCDFCETNDFFSISHTKLTALIERCEFLTSFETSWLRICSYNSLLKLKFCLQSLQITRTFVISKFDEISIDFDITSNVLKWKFEFFETRRINAFENAFAKILSKRFNEINSDWVLNYSDAKSHKHFDNKFNKFDLRYRCWHCSKCCKKFAISLYCSKSDSLQVDESNVSISWNFDVDFTVIVFNSVRFAIFRAIRFARFWIIAFSSRCFCEKNVFVKIILKRNRKLKCDRFLYHFQTRSLKIQSMYSSNFVRRYRYNVWQCSKFRRKFVTSLNCLIFESEHDKLELKKSISRKKSKESKFENSENIENIAKIWKKRWLTK